MLNEEQNEQAVINESNLTWKSETTPQALRRREWERRAPSPVEFYAALLRWKPRQKVEKLEVFFFFFFYVQKVFNFQLLQLKSLQSSVDLQSYRRCRLQRKETRDDFFKILRQLQRDACGSHHVKKKNYNGSDPLYFPVLLMVLR